MVDACEFRVPVHAVDVELEIPGRFFVRDVWEVEDDSTTEQCEALEGEPLPCARFPFVRRERTKRHHPRLHSPCELPVQKRCSCCSIFAELESTLMADNSSWVNITSNEVFDKLYSILKWVPLCTHATHLRPGSKS